MTRTFTLLLFIFTLLGFSQTEKIISGKIIYQDLILKGVEVINFNSKKIVITNDAGEFKIPANLGDELIILTDKYLNTSVVISSKNFNKNIIINLTEKAIELDEVEITTQQKMKPIITYEDLAMIKIAKDNARPQPTGVYTGEMVNGADFVQIAKMIGKLFKSKKKKNKEVIKNIDFKEYAKTNFSSDFFSKTLELKPDEISLFLDYCQDDPKSKDAINSDDEFIILNFLITKKADFRKMLSENNR